MNNLLTEIYYDESHPGGYSTAKKLYDAAKTKWPLTLKDVENWLSKEIVYTLHKPARKRWKRNRIIVKHIDEQWQADLVDMQLFKRTNSGHGFILTVIDIFSKFAWAKPIKTKTGVNVRNALEEIFKERVPSSIQTDKGTEFLNPSVKNLFKNYGVHHFTSRTPVKCAVVERFNRTLKNKMFKFFAKIGRRRFVESLPKIIDAYNNTIHTTTKRRPVEVNVNNEHQVYKNMYVNNVKANLKPGEKVRVKYDLNKLDRGYYANWSDAIYTIKAHKLGTDKPLYKIVDYKYQTVDRRFYRF
jgi:hypothetical protein